MIETTVRERPILFSGQMVAAILAGTKTQTRRVIKPQPDSKWVEFLINTNNGGDSRYYVDGEPTMHIHTHREISDNGECPYGQVGDRLWVRETWRPLASIDSNFDAKFNYGRDVISYRADQSDVYAATAWRPSIFMPRWASRLTLEITEVRARRLNDISIEDVLAEGIEKDMTDSQYWRENTGNRFTSLWNSINSKRGYTWESNPFVWCISFKQVSA